MNLAQHAFDVYGGHYDGVIGRLFAPLYQRVVEDTVAIAPAGGVVLDAGAGPGRVAVMLASRRPDLTVYAVDLAPGMVAAAQERVSSLGLADRVRPLLADLAEIPLPDGSVDLVISSASFHHWRDVPGVVAGLRRVVKDGGPIRIYDARVAPWKRLAGAVGRAVPRTRSGLLWDRAEIC